MNKTAVCLLSFIFGAAVGGAVMYYVESSKYNEEKDIFYENEIRPAREEYLNKKKELGELEKSIINSNKIAKEKLLDTYEDVNKTLGYVKDAALDKAEEIKESVEDAVEPLKNAAENLINDVKDTVINTISNDAGPDAYFISAEEYDAGTYEQIPLTYHTNGVIVTDNYEIVDDYEELIGSDNYEKLSEMLDDGSGIAYIRNDDTQTDFEILLADHDFIED